MSAATPDHFRDLTKMVNQLVKEDLVSDIQCFMIRKVNRCRQSLRRFVFDSQCPATELHIHDASTPIEDGEIEDSDRGYRSKTVEPPHDDPRWPTHCACGYEFQPNDEWQLFHDRIYEREDTSEECTLRNPPVGAMWDCDWLAESWHGDDGRCIAVMTPGGQWIIDSKASNCTRPDDYEHKCWVRHGVPPNLHVDKSGNTCAAGAGSILCNGYHAFLHNGHLVEC
jgi:hypothetical protein